MAEIVAAFFYTFLDISGILLGVFLIVLGWWIALGHPVSKGIGWVVLALGLCAFFIHTGHYFQLKIVRWIFGSESYFHKDEM
ncbi:MAG: hypothetical protein JSS87_00765 [Acidobacteria bacterium]|nr:hypothetical protein [Acidobacteriota bacterium]